MKPKSGSTPDYINSIFSSQKISIPITDATSVSTIVQCDIYKSSYIIAEFTLSIILL
jgi:hypothetical protein